MDALADWIGHDTNETAAVAGCTALMAVVGSEAAGRLEDTVAAVARTLIKLGADLSASDRNGRTALHYAVHPRGASCARLAARACSTCTKRMPSI